MLRLKVIRIAVAEFLVQVFAHLGKVCRCRIQELEVVDLDHNRQIRHFVNDQPLPNNLVHKQDARLRVVYQIVYVAGFEFVQDGDGDGAIGERRQKTHAPVGLVAGADGHFISFPETALLKGYMQFSNTPGHVPVRQGHALVVGERSPVPVANKALLQNFVNGFKFHIR